MNPSQSRLSTGATNDRVGEAESLYRSGMLVQLDHYLGGLDSWTISDEARSRLLVLKGMSRFDGGDIVGAIEILRAASDHSRELPATSQFATSFALFVREAEFQSPEEALPGIARLRQLSTQIGDAKSLAGLHLAVARLEGLRGHCSDAHRHLEIAKRFSERCSDVPVRLAIQMSYSTLESISGNLTR